jgi:hypothetical protein
MLGMAPFAALRVTRAYWYCTYSGTGYRLVITCSGVINPSSPHPTSSNVTRSQLGT